MKTAYDIIIRPVIPEQSMEGAESKKYVFMVATDANKVEIKKAVEEIFKVKVDKVNTISMKAKNKRVGYHFGKTSEWKKAISLPTHSDFAELGEQMTIRCRDACKRALISSSRSLGCMSVGAKNIGFRGVFASPFSLHSAADIL